MLTYFIIVYLFLSQYQNKSYIFVEYSYIVYPYLLYNIFYLISFSL